jgi:class 3 adenylate cyclase
VSVLFVDLVGFTNRSDRADPEDVRATPRPYHERVKSDIERFGAAALFGEAVAGWAAWGSVPLRGYALLGLGNCAADERALAEGQAILASLSAAPVAPPVAQARQQQVYAPAGAAPSSGSGSSAAANAAPCRMSRSETSISSRP